MNDEGSMPEDADSSLSPHPSSLVLNALSLGQLTEAELAPILDHLGDCRECCRRIDQLVAADPLLSRLQQRAAHQGKVLVSPAQRRPAVRALRNSHEASSASLPQTTHTPIELPAPKQVGDYDILAEIGRGGMGVVYKARHTGLHRLAALKMVLAGQFASAAQELRFRLEAELAARVQHPNIVQVYEIGNFEGRPFLALEWVEGGSLADRLTGKPWPSGEAAALIETLARAINVAHDEGVVHRDLKPANVLLAKKSEIRISKSETDPNIRIQNPGPPSGGASDSDFRISDFEPKITDFGLALTTEGGQMMTQSGFLVGTPGYMAPEQASGKRSLVGPATDIYSLGVVLYQLLTGQLPFQGDSTLELLRQVTSDEPTRPRRLQPRLPRDLEAITLHCLEKEPRRRYSSALALAEDLQRFREGRQVRARPVGAAARLARACRRRPLVALLLALLAASTLGGLVGVTWKWQEANAHARQADAEKQAALYQAYRACLAAASAALQNHDVGDAARQLEPAPVALRGWEWRHLDTRLDDSASLVRLPADGGVLIAAPHQLRVGIWTSAGLRLTDLEGGDHGTLPLGPAYRRHGNVTQTRRGLRLAAWVESSAFDLLDDAGKVLSRVATPANPPPLVVASPDGKRLACWTDGNQRRVAVFDADSGKQIAICDGHSDAIWTFTFSPDSSRLATGSEDQTARLWDAASGTLLATCGGHTSKVVSTAFSPDGSRLVTASTDETVRQWDTRTGKEAEPAYDRHSSDVFCAVYSPDGNLVASAGDDRTIRVWQAKGRQDVAVLQGHTGRITEVAFAPDGRRLASLSSRSALFSAGDDTVRYWDVDPRATLPALRGHTRAIYPVTYSPDGRWLASGSYDGKVCLWDAATGEPCATLLHDSTVMGIAFGPDSTWLMTGCGDDRLRIWDVATTRLLKDFKFPGRRLQDPTISPDGTRVAATSSDAIGKQNRLIVCNLATGEPLFSTEGSSLGYSPDGRWLAALDADDRTILLLDALTHETVARFSGHEQRVFKATFSLDCRLLASCSQDRTVRIWNVEEEGKRVKDKESAPSLGSNAPRPVVLHGHNDEVYAVAFHPDGTRLATAGRDGTVWLWDVARGTEVVRLPGHKSFVWSLAFSPNGATLASGSGDATVRLWDTMPLKARYQARREAAGLRPEAERLVKQLWREKKEPAAVAEALRADRMLSDELRQACFRAVLRDMQTKETDQGNKQGPP
jgi:eukaryotic-like serine/threonine-protein kinase